MIFTNFYDPMHSVIIFETLGFMIWFTICIYEVAYFNINLNLFPLKQTKYRVGVVFAGRQSPGGHNVIWGLHDALKKHNPGSVLLGFLG